MERGGLQWRARSSFEKAHGEAPPRLQVIGFNVCAPKLAEAREDLEIMNASSDHNEAPASHDLLSFENKPKPSASSPRSALQQLLLNQSLPSTSSPSSNHSLPYGLLLLPPSTSSELLTPAISSPSPNHNLTSGLQPAISPPAANHNWTINISKLGHTPSSGHLKSLLQSENASSDNQHSRNSLFSSLGQSPCASSSSSSGNQSMKGGCVSVNVQMINRHNPKPSQAPIKENYEAFFRIKQKADDEACYIEERKKINNGNDAKTHEISEKEVINEFPYVAKSQKSSWFHDNEHPSAVKCQKSMAVQQSTEHSFCNEKGRKGSRNEEKSKKNTLFMFVVSSPAPEFHDHHHHGENNMSKDMDFLSSCHLCKCFLRQGEDVFMYSGDKAFCSMECRYQQIVIDERKERCPPPIIRSGASQVYQHTSITTTTTTHHPIMINKAHFIKTAAAA